MMLRNLSKLKNIPARSFAAAKMIPIKIDGQEYEVEAGLTIFQACYYHG